MSQSKPIGELNGGWAILLKLSLATFPVFVTLSAAHASWASVAIIQNSYFRQLATVEQQDTNQKVAAIQAAINALPPPEWRARVAAVEDDQKKLLEQTGRILVEIEYLKKSIAK